MAFAKPSHPCSTNWVTRTSPRCILGVTKSADFNQEHYKGWRQSGTTSQSQGIHENRGKSLLVLCQSKNSTFSDIVNRNPNLRLDNQHQTTHKKKGSWSKPLTTCSISLSFNCERTILSCLVNQGTRSNTHIYAIPAAYRLDLDADKKTGSSTKPSQHTWKKVNLWTW